MTDRRTTTLSSMFCRSSYQKTLKYIKRKCVCVCVCEILSNYWMFSLFVMWLLLSSDSSSKPIQVSLASFCFKVDVDHHWWMWSCVIVHWRSLRSLVYLTKLNIHSSAPILAYKKASKFKKWCSLMCIKIYIVLWLLYKRKRNNIGIKWEIWCKVGGCI